MKKLIALLLLVSFGLLGGAPYSAAAITQTNVSGLEVDCGSDPAGATTDACVEVQDRSASNTVTVDGAGNVALLETGGTTSDPDLSVAGYTQHTDTVEVVTGGKTEYLRVADATVSAQYTQLNSMYIQLYAFQASLRPASGAPGAGTIIAINNANNTGDCGTAGGGSTYVICTNTGSSWRSL